MIKYRLTCDLCGYEHDEPITNMEDEQVCVRCNHLSLHHKKVVTRLSTVVQETPDGGWTYCITNGGAFVHCSLIEQDTREQAEYWAGKARHAIVKEFTMSGIVVE